MRSWNEHLLSFALRVKFIILQLHFHFSKIFSIFRHYSYNLVPSSTSYSRNYVNASKKMTTAHSQMSAVSSCLVQHRTFERRIRIMWKFIAILFRSFGILQKSTSLFQFQPSPRLSIRDYPIQRWCSSRRLTIIRRLSQPFRGGMECLQRFDQFSSTYVELLLFRCIARQCNISIFPSAIQIPFPLIQFISHKNCTFATFP